MHLERDDLEFRNRCPQQSCERNLRGFARYANLRDHYRRRHHGELPENLPDDPEPMVVDSGDSSDDRRSPPTSPIESAATAPGSPPNSERSRSADRARESITSALRNLRSESKDLDKMQQKIHRQIKTLEELLSEMDRTR